MLKAEMEWVKEIAAAIARQEVKIAVDALREELAAKEIEVYGAENKKTNAKE